MLSQRSTLSNVSISSCNLSAPSIENVKVPVKTLNYSIKEITKDVAEPVIITHINSPSDFYLQLIANNSAMKMVTDELYKFVHTKESHVNHIEMSKFKVILGHDNSFITFIY